MPTDSLTVDLRDQRPAEATKSDTPKGPEPQAAVWIAVVFAAVSLIIACVALGLATRPGGATSAATTASRDLFVAEHDYALTPTSTQVAGGQVRVRVANFGPSSHELLAFRSDLPPDALPVGANGRIIEDSPDITKVLDTQTDLAPGTQRVLNAELAPGRYVIVCNLANHYRLGMRYSITVTD